MSSPEPPPSPSDAAPIETALGDAAPEDAFAAATDPLVISYLGIRRAIGLSGLLLPVALGLGGLALGIPIQDDMSSYYHTALRDVLVGTLCAIGIFLLCYKGHDAVENWTANFCCFSALGLAFFPIDANSEPPFQHTLTGYLHTLSGGIFFVTLAVYSIVHFPRDAGDEPPDKLTRQRNVVYRTSGLVLLSSMGLMGIYLFLLPADVRTWCDRWNTLFWLEWIALWSFAAAWLTKGRLIGSELALVLFAEAERQLPGPLRPSGYGVLGGATPRRRR